MRVPRKVLLAEDDAANRVTLGALLEDEGFAVDAAPSFREAQAKLAAEAARYDLVLLDQQLGDGLGTDLVPLIQARHPAAKMVLLCGAGPNVDCGGAEPPCPVLPKGARFPEILALIERLLA